MVAGGEKFWSIDKEQDGRPRTISTDDLLNECTSMIIIMAKQERAFHSRARRFESVHTSAFYKSISTK